MSALCHWRTFSCHLLQRAMARRAPQGYATDAVYEACPVQWSVVANPPASSIASSDFLWNGVVNHVPNAGNQQKRTVRNLFRKNRQATRH